MEKLIKITWILSLSVWALSFLGGCGGGGGGGTATSTTPAAPTTPATSAITTIPTLELGTPVRSGNSVTIPLTLTSAPGNPISGLEVDIGFDSKAFALITNGSTPVSATLGEAAIVTDKLMYQSKSSTQQDVLHFAIIDLGGKKNIGSGVVALIRFSVVQDAPSGRYTFSFKTNATNANGVATTVAVTNSTVNFSL